MDPKLRRTAVLIASSELWIVAAATGLSMIKTTLLPWAVLVALLYWPVRWAAEGRPSRRTPVDWGIVLLLLMLPVTLWATALPEKTVPQVYRLVLGILFFYAILNWSGLTRKLDWVVAGILLAGVALAGMSVFSVQWATTKLQFIPASIYQQFELLVSDAIHPNVMGGNLTLIAPIGAALLLYGWKSLKRWQNLLVLAATLVISGMLLLTQSRGALMGFGAALVLLVVLRWRWGWVAIPLAALALGAAIYLIGWDTALDFIASGVSVEGLEGREEIWSRAIYMIQDFAFTGIGMGSFGEVADLLYPFFLAAPGKIVHAHNLILQIAVDLGIPGLIAWLSIFFGISFISWQLYRHGMKHNDRLAAALGAGFLGMQTALLIHGMTDAVTWGMIRPAPLVWGLWGTATATWMLLKVEGERLKVEG